MAISLNAYKSSSNLTPASKTLAQIESWVQPALTQIIDAGLSTGSIKSIASTYADDLLSRTPDYFKKASIDIINNINANQLEETKSTSDMHSFPADVTKLDYYMKLSFFKYSRPSPNNKAAPIPADSFILPLPADLSEALGVDYSTGNLGPTVGTMLDIGTNTTKAIVNSVTNGKIDTPAIKAAFDQDFKTAMSGDKVTQISGAIRGGISENMTAITQGLGIFGQYAESAERALNQIMGNIPNPHLSVFFNGPMLRAHEFTWRLVPTNAKEAQSLRRIITLLKRNTSPGITADSASILLDYPNMCTIDIVTKHQNLYYIKNCVVAQVLVRYNADAANAFYIDGQPVSVQLTLKIEEIEYHTADDYADKKLVGVRSMEGGKAGVPGVPNADSVTPTGRALNVSDIFRKSGQRISDIILTDI